MNKQQRVLAIASGGGHWHQLMQLREALPPHQTIYASPLPKAGTGLADEPYWRITDGNRDTKGKLLICLVQLLLLIAWHRPHMVISTGAAPGYLAMRLARLHGARCLFIDSVANAGELSLSARLARDSGYTVYSQWPEVATAEKVNFAGAVFSALHYKTESVERPDREVAE
ncbi:MAG: UDP-N-acetylglucosamine--LPS N-acetylglucosamine transferase [Pseudomonadota bacterium]